MASRLILQSTLEEILGTNNVYFQPPESLKLNYPCIIYELTTFKDHYADNLIYEGRKQYKLTLVHSNPDNDIVEALRALPLCKFSTSFTKDYLNHYIFNIYY